MEFIVVDPAQQVPVRASPSPSTSESMSTCEDGHRALVLEPIPSDRGSSEDRASTPSCLSGALVFMARKLDSQGKVAPGRRAPGPGSRPSRGAGAGPQPSCQVTHQGGGD